MGSQTADVLRRAADLIEPEGAWTQGEFGRNAGGSLLGEALDDLLADVTSEYCVCRCAMGAIVAAYGEDYDEALLPGDQLAVVALGAVVGGDVPGWNDAEGRTQAEVVAKLREAADRQELDEGSGDAGDE